MTSFDDLIEQTGGLGRYQFMLILMFTCLVFPTSYNTLLPLFVLTTPKHRCAIPGMDNDTYAVQSPYHQQLIQDWIPLEKDGDDWVMSSCKLFSNDTVDDQLMMSNRSQHSCDKWVYDKEYFERSMIEEFNVVCDRKQFRAHANSAMMAGKFFSALIEGLISDRFGRRVSLLTFIIIMVTSSFLNAFTFNIPTLVVFRFLSGLGTTSLYMSVYLLTLEFIPTKYRQTFNVYAGLCWIAASFMVTLLAYFIRDFQNLCLATAAPGLILLSYFWLAPESGRWLLTHGRIKDARNLLKKIAKVNRKEFPESNFNQVVKKLHFDRIKINDPVTSDTEVQGSDTNKSTDEVSFEGQGQVKKENLFDVIRHRRLAIRVMIVFWNWCANSLTYYGILFNVQNLVGSIYINFTISNVVELVVNLVSLYVVDRFGRKRAYVFSFALSTVACLAVIIPFEVATKHDLNISVLCLSMAGRAGVSCAFSIMYLYSSEMFPTTTRGVVLGSASMFSRLGSFAAPYIADMGLLVGGNFQTMLPLLIFGCVGATATLSALALPETVGIKLPNTVDDALAI